MKRLTAISMTVLTILLTLAISALQTQAEYRIALKLTEIHGCRELAADSDYVYFTEYLGDQREGSVRRVRWNLPAENYPTESDILVHGEDPLGIAIDTDYVYYMIHGDRGTEKVMRIPKDGGDPEVLAYPREIRGCRHTRDIIVDPTGLDPYVYFAVRDGPGSWSDPNGYIGKVLKTGGAVIELTPSGEVSDPMGIAIDSDYVYFTQCHSDENGEISRVSKDGGEVISLTGEIQPPEKLVVDEDWVYFAEFVENGRVGKVAKNANGTIGFLALNQSRPYGVTIDEEFIYFTEWAGNVKRVPKNGGEIQTLATGMYCSAGIIATIPNQVFFTDLGEGLPGTGNPGGVYTLLFDETARRQLSVDAEGAHDYLPWENVKVKIAALVVDISTMEPVSDADVTITIYDPEDNLWINDTMTEKLNHGIYLWESTETVRQIFRHHEKGVYLVHVQASYDDGPTTSDILTFHIDPPPEENNQLLIIGTTITAIAILAAAILYIIKKQSP